MKQALYDTYDYPRYWLGREYEDQAEKIALKKLFKLIPSQQRDSLVDIGGGFGRLAPVYAPLFKHCLLVDPSRRLLVQAKKKLRRRASKIKLQEGSVEALPAASGQFDAALLVRVIHHLPDPEKALLEAYRVLKRGGFFILEFANKIHFLACLRAWSKTDLHFTKVLKPVNQSTQKKGTTTIPFLNHHPQLIEKQLRSAGFKILTGLSVSNFRYPHLKHVLPLRWLLFFESLLQKPLYLCRFGPSIFLLCQKS